MVTSHAPRRIASLQPSATVILAMIGELHRVVACTKYCVDVVPEVVSQPHVVLADSWTADARQILDSSPDLVIASVPYQEKAVSEILRAGVRFLGLAPKTLADIYGDIAMIAGIVGAGDRGKSEIRRMQERIEEVRDKVQSGRSNERKPRVFCEEWGKPLIASQTWVAELVEAAGGEFIGTPGRQVAPEDIARLDPDVLIAAWCGAGDRVPLEKVVQTRGWENMRAVQHGHVYCIRDEYLNTPAPTLLKGLDALALAIHPEVFSKPEGMRQITLVPSSASIHTGS